MGESVTESPFSISHYKHISSSYTSVQSPPLHLEFVCLSINGPPNEQTAIQCGCNVYSPSVGMMILFKRCTSKDKGRDDVNNSFCFVSMRLLIMLGSGCMWTGNGRNKRGCCLKMLIIDLWSPSSQQQTSVCHIICLDLLVDCCCVDTFVSDPLSDNDDPTVRLLLLSLHKKEMLLLR